MNKKLTVIAAAMIVCSSTIVSAKEADPFLEYGSKSFENDFDKTTTENLGAYPYYITPADKASISSAQVRAGRSVEMDIGSMEAGSTAKMLFSFHNTQTTPEHEYYYIEGYVKGLESITDSFMPYYEYNGSIAPVLDYGSEAADNGWIRVWYTVPALESYVVNGHVGWRYIKDSSSPDKIWIDDVSMRPIPKEIELLNRSCINTKEFDLTQIPVWGYSPDGKRHEIVNKKDIRWTVLSGEAAVNGSVLSFNSSDAQTIELEADFYGITGVAKLQADEYSGACQWGEAGDISAVITKNDTGYTASVTNTGKDDSIYLISAVYIDGKLYDMNYKKEYVAKGTTAIVDCRIPSVPAGLGGTVTSKAFVWTKLFGADGIADFK